MRPRYGRTEISTYGETDAKQIRRGIDPRGAARAPAAGALAGPVEVAKHSRHRGPRPERGNCHDARFAVPATPGRSAVCNGPAASFTRTVDFEACPFLTAAEAVVRAAATQLRSASTYLFNRFRRCASPVARYFFTIACESFVRPAISSTRNPSHHRRRSTV